MCYGQDWTPLLYQVLRYLPINFIKLACTVQELWQFLLTDFMCRQFVGKVTPFVNSMDLGSQEIRVQSPVHAIFFLSFFKQSNLCKEEL